MHDITTYLLLFILSSGRWWWHISACLKLPENLYNLLRFVEEAMEDRGVLVINNVKELLMWSWIAVQRRALFARQRRGSSICVRGIVLCVKCHSTKMRIPSDGRFVVDDGRRQEGQTGEVGMLLAPLVFPIWVIMWSGFFTMVRSCKMVWAGWWDVENLACSCQKKKDTVTLSVQIWILEETVQFFPSFENNKNSFDSFVSTGFFSSWGQSRMRDSSTRLTES